jgi:hypothetical protein
MFVCGYLCSSETAAEAAAAVLLLVAVAAEESGVATAGVHAGMCS